MMELKIDNLKEAYLEKGVIVIPDVFTQEECEEIKRQAYLVKDEDIIGAGYPHSASQTSYNKKSLIFFPALCNDYLNAIRTDERMVSLVKEFIGEDVRQINNQVYFREAGDRDQFAWHQDIMFRESNIFNEDVEEDYFQTIIAVDDINIDNGAVEFVEGSHRMPMIESPTNLRVFERNGIVGKKYTATKGSVLIWSVMILHGSEPNMSQNDRMTYMNGFCRTKACKNYPHYLINGQVVKYINPNLIP
jgi:ectoine hydroxylase-related dioxygenase (phytanoyl-CoA dioxygenase family)